jgi:hypothetical protein
MEQIRDLMAKLSSQHPQKVLDFAQYLAEKKRKPKRKKLRLDWEVDWPSSMKVIHLWNCRKNPWIGGAIELPHRFKDIM